MWGTGEPNNSGIRGEYCGGLLRHKGYNLNDESCSSRFPAICQMQSESKFPFANKV